MSSVLNTDKRSYSYGVNDCANGNTSETTIKYEKVADVYECGAKCDATQNCGGFLHAVDTNECVVRISKDMLSCNSASVGARFQYYLKP